ncbi:FUSC family protein [Streptomyces sp. NPDC002044]|uniref:FUSC family protein n=1 Tax=Streptomyces sp. NPDC002044 TaxID=3154662 RepID=UPI00331A4BB9
MGRDTDTGADTVDGGDDDAGARGHPSALAQAIAEVRAGTGPTAATARRAVRVTLAACTGFYVFLYVLDRPVSATYALFAAVSLAALSRIPGTGRQRAAQIARVLPVACVLVTIGTFLAVRTWTAVAGMLVIGFCLAFASAGGPRPAGAAPGLQLLYILPCFPPYLPGALGERLAGAVAGIVLLVLAEAYVLPDPRLPTYRDRAADAATTAARCAAALREPPYALPAPLVELAGAAGEALRPSHVPEGERPAGPGVHERALAHTGLAARTLLVRLRALPGPLAGARPGPAGLALIRSVERSARATAALLSDGPTAEDAGSAERGLRHDRAGSARLLPPVPGDRRRQAALLEVADAALVLGTAADLAVRGRDALPEGDPGRFWYAGMSTLRLWWIRLSGHAGPRSVHFQNAVRISLALAAARTVAGLDSLPHGFWAMLAVLSLTRTTAVQTRATVRAALTGTCLGALAAGGVLTLAGEASLPYAIALPPLMLVAFFVGPVRGVGWAQALFTLVVAVAFAQLAPTTWQLAEYRFLDVLVGSVIGLVCGLLAWPRGAHDEVGRAVARLLRAAAAEVTTATRAVTSGGRPPADGQPADGTPAGAAGPFGGDDPDVQQTLVLAESAYAQYQGETQRPAGPGPDWQSALMAGHHVLWGARRVLAAVDGAPPDHRADARVRAYGAWVAEGFGLAAARFDVPKDARNRAAPRPGPGAVAGVGAGGPQASDATLDAPPVFFTAVAWLDSLTADLARMAAAHAVETPLPAAGRPGTARSGSPSRGRGGSVG